MSERVVCVSVILPVFLVQIKIVGNILVGNITVSFKMARIAFFVALLWCVLVFFFLICFWCRQKFFFKGLHMISFHC